MQTVSIQKANKLSPSVKSAVEELLGRQIDDDEEVSVIAGSSAADSTFAEPRSACPKA